MGVSLFFVVLQQMGRVSLRSFSKLGHFEVEQKQHSNELRRKDNPKVISRSTKVM